MHRRTADHFAACLLGGALGDALGWPVEFLKLRQIQTRYGPAGLIEPVLPPSGVLETTDDTQMTLFTAEGLIRAHLRWMGRGICHAPSVVHDAYRRWYRTQTERWPGDGRFDPDDGWLITNRELWNCRAPGNTCMSALSNVNMDGAPRNDSKGCGTVMRTAPVGLVASNPFELGREISTLTHGHETAGLSAGFLSQVIGHLVEGETLNHSIAFSRELLLQHDHHSETLQAVDRACELAKGTAVTPEVVESLGGGWVAEEALAIALLAALRAESFEHGVRLAVNHSGDSDSTGAIAGNLLGLMMGRAALPKGWLESLELREVIEAISRDLFQVLVGDSAGNVTPDEVWSARYPGV